ncbi:MAG: nucleotide-binding universal stress UspA family protein [Yoonia sp.]|jgi:nucleotide-binding universal stress UspA family protein
MYNNILVPVVFDEQHDTQASYLAALTLAAEGAKFTIVHVLETIPTYAAAEIPPEVLARGRKEVADSLAQTATALPNAELALISGNAGRAIVDYANEHGIDCIVLASHRPGFGDFFLGSTASKVVRHAKCSVHVIR